jgi:hypothetical protein
MTVTAGDQLTSHVRQLFKLTEEQQKAALASLSSYGEKQRQDNLIALLADGYGRSKHAVEIPVPSTKPSMDSRGTLLNDGSSLATCNVPTEPMKVSFGGTKTGMPSQTSPLLSAAPDGAPVHKVVQELGNNLPKGVTTILQDLLAVAESWDSQSVGQQQLPQTQGHISNAPDGKIAAVRLLMQQLEKDQEASVRKLHNMMGHPCSMDNGLGMTLPLHPPSTFSLPFTGEPSHESLHCKDLTGCFDGVAHAAQPEQSCVGTMGDCSPHGGSMFFPGAEGRQQQTAEVGKSVGPPTEGCLGQNSGRKGMMGQSQTSVPGGSTGWQQETLRMHLRSLVNVDSGRVLIVRKINRLGFASQAALLEHFSWYGVVERVLVAHSRVKSTSAADKGASPVSSRLRPSGLGFLVMSRVEDAQAILANGSEQPVNGIMVRIQQFQRQVTAHEEDYN